MDAPHPNPNPTPSPVPDGRRRTTSTWVWVLVVAVVAAPFALVSGWYAWSKVSGTPVWDEWVCSDGEAPVLVEGGGSFCAPESAELDEGQTWDPFGNRPFVCHDRWGFTEVFRPDAGDGTTSPDVLQSTTECVRDGREIPAGWEPVPQGWDPSEDLPKG